MLHKTAIFATNPMINRMMPRVINCSSSSELATGPAGSPSWPDLSRRPQTQGGELPGLTYTRRMTCAAAISSRRAGLRASACQASSSRSIGGCRAVTGRNPAVQALLLGGPTQLPYSAPATRDGYRIKGAPKYRPGCPWRLQDWHVTPRNSSENSSVMRPAR